MPLERLILVIFIFTMVEENFEISYSQMPLEWLILVIFIFNMVEENFEFSPLEWLFGYFHLHHGWRKFWNFIPIDALRMTNFGTVLPHHSTQIGLYLVTNASKWYEHSAPAKSLGASATGITSGAPLRRKNGHLCQRSGSSTAWIPPWTQTQRQRHRHRDRHVPTHTHTNTFTRTECRHMIANERDRQSNPFEQQGDRQHRRREAA